jgi:hypothetical protein
MIAVNDLDRRLFSWSLHCGSTASLFLLSCNKQSSKPPSRATLQGGATRAGQHGTLSMLYLAPELLRGESPSPASDMFAFAMLAFELLQGELLAAGIAMQADLSGRSDAAALAAHAQATMDGERCTPGRCTVLMSGIARWIAVMMRYFRWI